MANAKLVLTDSEGIREETTILGIPCVTIRENTERPITVTHGTKPPPFWDGKAPERIVGVLAKSRSGARIQNPEYRIEPVGGGGEAFRSTKGVVNRGKEMRQSLKVVFVSLDQEHDIDIF